MLNRAKRVAFGPPRCEGKERKKKKKSNMQHRENQEETVVGLARSAARLHAHPSMELSRQDTVLPPCGPAAAPSYASCQRPAKCPTPGLLCHAQGSPGISVGGWGGLDWRELGEWDEEACGWLQVRVLIDRGKCEGVRLIAPVQRWMTTSCLCHSSGQSVYCFTHH